ncbi:MAG: hypothetical protein PSX80_14545 [bacterium]|nr:hypothetical protein [bacterium]
MQKEQKQTHHGGTGEQDTELGASADEKRPEDPNTLQTGERDEDARVRNPSGDDIGDAVDGDEGSGRTV